MKMYVIRFKKGHNDRMRYAIVYAQSVEDALKQFDTVGINLAENRVSIANETSVVNGVLFTNEERTAYQTGWEIR